MEKYYRIADHLVGIHCSETHDTFDLLPSFVPFLVNEIQQDEEPILWMNVDDGFEFHALGKEIGSFDCGGNMYDVFQTEQGEYQFIIHAAAGQVCCIMQCSLGFHRCKAAIKADHARLRAFGLNSCMMIAYAFSTINQQTLLVHASVIRKDGRGYLMTAPSGTGKSTHTSLWSQYIPGSDLMNDDNPVVRIIDGKSIVYGSPWSGKTPCYRNIQAPIGAIVRIQQRPENRIRPMNPVESLAVMLSQVDNMKWDRTVYHTVCQTLGQLFACTPMFELGCLPNAEAAKICYETVSKAYV